MLLDLIMKCSWQEAVERPLSCFLHLDVVLTPRHSQEFSWWEVTDRGLFHGMEFLIKESKGKMENSWSPPKVK